MMEDTQNDLHVLIQKMKTWGYTYKDGKFYNKKGSLASYPFLIGNTDNVRLFFIEDNHLKVFEAPLEQLVLAWHNKPVSDDVYPTPVDGDISNTHVENLVYLEDGEKTEDSKCVPRTEEDLQTALYYMGAFPNVPAHAKPAELLGDIALQHKDRDQFPMPGAAHALYPAFVRSRMNKNININDSFVNYAMGLAGEAGEVANIVKKYRYHGHPLDTAEVVDELGDVLFYLQAMCNVLGVDLAEVILHNARKLSIRYPKGFDPEKSKNREDVKE